MFNDDKNLINLPIRLINYKRIMSEISLIDES
jgi:hypothetical protein